MIRLSISWKLLAVSAIVGAVATGIAVNGLRRMHALNERLTRLVDYSSEKVKLAAILKQDVTTITRAEKNLILAPSVEIMQRHAVVIDETLATMQKHLQRLSDLVDDDDQVQLDTFAKLWLEWQSIHTKVRNIAQLNSNMRARNLALGKGRETFERLEESLNKLADAFARPDPAAEAGGASEAKPASNQILNQVAQLLSIAAQLQLAEKQVILASNQKELEEYDRAFAPLLEQADLRFRELDRHVDDSAKQLLAEAKAAFTEHAAVLAETRSVLDQRGNFFVYQFAFEQGAPLAANCERVLDEIIDQNERELQTARSQSDLNYFAARNRLLGFSAVGVVISVAVTYFTGQHIAKNLGRLALYTQEMRNTGDLSKPVPQVSRDEVGELAESIDHLRQSLHRQTSELAALNLALEQKSKEMEQFVYTISHDLSSPLVSCKGLVGLINEDVAAGNFDEVVASSRKLDGSVDQLRRIIDDLLTLSRIGRKPLHLTRVNVAKLITDLQEELAGRLQNVQAELRIEASLPEVTADATDVKRVFENLLTNAIKYACEGDSPVITVGGLENPNEVRYFVRDAGPGIAADYHEQIFGLFQRLDSERPGTGVGLASVMKIMRMHSGRAWVESTPGQGATFWIAFPRKSPMLGSLS